MTARKMTPPLDVENAPATMFAERPWRLGRDDWRAVLGRVWQERGDDDISTQAAAVAFSALFSIPTLLVAVVSLYGLLASPQQIEQLIEQLGSVAPSAAVELIGDQLRSIGEQGGGSLSIALVAGLAGAIWSVSGGIGRLRESINTVYEEKDERSWYWKRLSDIGAAIATIVFITVSVGLITALPAMLDAVDVGDPVRGLVLVLRWPLLGSMMLALVAALFRYGPDRPPPSWSWISVGTVLAAVAWVAMSFGFSIYTQNFASYNETYGSLGTVVIFMMWLYLSAYILLMAGELNAELEHQTLADTTTSPTEPIGERGAYVADHVPDDVFDRAR